MSGTNIKRYYTIQIQLRKLRGSGDVSSSTTHPVITLHPAPMLNQRNANLPHWSAYDVVVTVESCFANPGLIPFCGVYCANIKGINIVVRKLHRCYRQRRPFQFIISAANNNDHLRCRKHTCYPPNANNVITICLIIYRYPADSNTCWTYSQGNVP